MSVLFTYSAQASNIPPIAVLNSTPNQTWFYNLEEVVFNRSSSYDTDGYINYAKWYINGVYQAGGPYYGSMSTCFALYGSPSNGCYQLANGITTVTVGLEVRDNQGEWSTMVTKTYTIQEHKGRKYFVKDHLGSVRATVNRDGNVLGYDDYYPFGLVMPGRSSNSANANDNYKFTSHELDDEAGLSVYHMNARGMDPVLGRMMQIDSRAEKYPGISPYAYVLNSPVNFTDMTGDTVDVDDKLLEEARYREGHERAGELKDLADMTDQEKQAYYFQQWWDKNEDAVEAVFGIGGEFETTNINFISASNMPDKENFYFFFIDAEGRDVDRGLTTFGMQGGNPAYFNSGKEYIPNFGINKLEFNVYFDNYEGYRAVKRLLPRASTAGHEMDHVLYIFDSFINKTTVLSASIQHSTSLKFPSLNDLKGN